MPALVAAAAAASPPRRRRGRPPNPTRPRILIPLSVLPTHPLAASATLPPLQLVLQQSQQQQQQKPMQLEPEELLRAELDAHLSSEDEEEGGGKEPQGRTRKSLQTLATQFMARFRDAAEVDIEAAAAALGAKKRRVYDITNVLEGLGLMRKTDTGRVVWLPPLGPAPPARPPSGLESLGRVAQQVVAEEHRAAIAALRTAAHRAAHDLRVWHAYARAHARELLRLLGLPPGDTPTAAVLHRVPARAGCPHRPLVVALAVPSGHHAVARALAARRPPRPVLRPRPRPAADDGAAAPDPTTIVLFPGTHSLTAAQLAAAGPVQSLFDEWLEARTNTHAFSPSLALAFERVGREREQNTQPRVRP